MASILPPVPEDGTASAGNGGDGAGKNSASLDSSIRRQAMKGY
jgi:hypothetical protein